MKHGVSEPAGAYVPNLAPMVDVIMVILIFFMLGASLNLMNEGVLKTELDPRSGPGEGAPVRIDPVVTIGLSDAESGRACEIRVLGEPLEGNTFEHLRQYLAQRRQAGADPANPVILAAQPTVRWDFVVKAMDAAIRAGFKNIQFAVNLQPN